MTKHELVSQLAQLLEHAARASVARGAMYDPGENITRDAAAEWRKVAEFLLGANVDKDRTVQLERTDGPR